MSGKVMGHLRDRRERVGRLEGGSREKWGNRREIGEGIGETAGRSKETAGRREKVESRETSERE